MIKHVFAFSLSASLFLAACQNIPQEPIKVGYIGPLTGEALSYGIDTINGTRLAVQDVNNAGGILGRKVELIAKDAHCNREDAANAAHDLIEIEGVVAIIGGQCSAETLGAAPIAESAHIPLISPVSSSPKISDAGSFVFRVYPSDALKTKATAKYLKQQGLHKLALITEDTTFAQDFRASLHEALGDAIVYDKVVAIGTRNFQEEADDLKTVDFDSLFPNVQSDVVMAALMNTLRKAGYDQPAITHDVGDSKTLGSMAAAAVEGMDVVTVPTAGDQGDFANLYAEKIGLPQQSLPFAAHAYDATHLLLQSIRRVGTNGRDIRDELLGITSYRGVVGSFRFDQQGDAVGLPFVLKKFHNGSLTTVQKPLPIE